MLVEWDIRHRLIEIEKTQLRQSRKIDDIERTLHNLVENVNETKNIVKQMFARIIGEDLAIKFDQGEDMSKISVRMAPKGAAPRAVMPPVTWTSATGSLVFQLIDAAGNPLGTIIPADVSTTLTAVDAGGNPSSLVTIAPGADSLNYSLSNNGTAGQFTLKATLSYVSGSPGPFEAECLFTVPPGPPNDLTIIFQG